jgi:hypothetical protein
MKQPGIAGRALLRTQHSECCQRRLIGQAEVIQSPLRNGVLETQNPLSAVFFL